MASIHEVAAKAGVSTATVARVLSGKTVVSPRLTHLVNEAVAELKYTPNAIARSLTRGRSNLLGLVVVDIANPFAAQLARGLEDEATKHGYHVLVGSSDFNPEREDQLLTSFAAKTVDAVAVISVNAESMVLKRLMETQIPLVFVDRRPTLDATAPLIRTDNLSAAHDAVDYLINFGHKDLAMISGPEAWPTAALRLQGFREACAEAGLRIRDECVSSGHVGSEGGYRAMKEILALKPRPTAVFSFNNMMAVGALKALQEAKLRLPDDLSFLTFDDMDLFPFVDPPITAIAQPAYQIGTEAAKVLLKLLAGEGSDVPMEITLPTEFRPRGSCAAPFTTGSGTHLDRGNQ